MIQFHKKTHKICKRIMSFREDYEKKNYRSKVYSREHRATVIKKKKEVDIEFLSFIIGHLMGLLVLVDLLD